MDGWLAGWMDGWMDGWILNVKMFSIFHKSIRKINN
jgi:hypothetical protein